MSKQIASGAPARVFASGFPVSLRAARGHVACCLVLFVCLCALVVGPTQLAVSQQPATTAAARNAALVAATEEVLKETSDLRQLSIIRPVQSSTQSRAEIEKSLIKNLDEDTSAADIHATEVTLKKLGLVPPDFQYRAFMIRLLTEQVAGYYEPKTRQFHLADWIDVDGQKPVMAHELTHALQDQHFDLRRFEHWPKGDSDAELAAHALIEGDASLAMTEYVSREPRRIIALMKSMVSQPATEELDRAPLFVRASLLFPYEEGMNWTRALYKQGGWSQVSQAFTTLPQSTEQIMHPEKYFAHEAPMKVTLPDITNLLNASASESPASAGASKPHVTWKRIASDVNGEWGTYWLLEQFLKSPADSRRAAAGWGGDRYAVYESSAGQAIFISTTVWDTNDDAREFYDAYCKRVGIRYVNAETRHKFDAPDRPTSVSDWKTNDGQVLVESSGARVIIIEGCPDSADLDKLAAMMLK